MFCAQWMRGRYRPAHRGLHQMFRRVRVGHSLTNRATDCANSWAIVVISELLPVSITREIARLNFPAFRRPNFGGARYPTRTQDKNRQKKLPPAMACQTASEFTARGTCHPRFAARSESRTHAPITNTITVETQTNGPGTTDTRKRNLTSVIENTTAINVRAVTKTEKLKIGVANEGAAFSKQILAWNVVHCAGGAVKLLILIANELSSSRTKQRSANPKMQSLLSQ